MNISLNSSRAATSVTHGFPTYFPQDSRAPLARGISKAALYAADTRATSHVNARGRVPYASALYAAAVAALLSACSQTEVQHAPEAAPIQLSETSSDMPEVVITAYAERPRAKG